MPNDEDLKRVEKATVTLTKKGGRGVLINGNFILTAAHCIDYSTDGKMMLGEYYIEDILTFKGPMKATPMAVEPVSDIAVLGPPDDQEFTIEMRRYYDFCEAVLPIPLCFDAYQIQEPFEVYIFTHYGKWITAEATLTYKDGEKLCIDFSEQIKPGTSGSPIVNGACELIGIVSNTSFNSGHPGSDGLVPRPHLTLPLWILNKIKDDQ